MSKFTRGFWWAKPDGGGTGRSGSSESTRSTAPTMAIGRFSVAGMFSEKDQNIMQRFADVLCHLWIFLFFAAAVTEFNWDAAPIPLFKTKSVLFFSVLFALYTVFLKRRRIDRRSMIVWSSILVFFLLISTTQMALGYFWGIRFDAGTVSAIPFLYKSHFALAIIIPCLAVTLSDQKHRKTAMLAVSTMWGVVVCVTLFQLWFPEFVPGSSHGPSEVAFGLTDNPNIAAVGIAMASVVVVAGARPGWRWPLAAIGCAGVIPTGSYTGLGVFGGGMLLLFAMGVLPIRPSRGEIKRLATVVILLCAYFIGVYNLRDGRVLSINKFMKIFSTFELIVTLDCGQFVDPELTEGETENPEMTLCKFLGPGGDFQIAKWMYLQYSGGAISRFVQVMAGWTAYKESPLFGLKWDYDEPDKAGHVGYLFHAHYYGIVGWIIIPFFAFSLVLTGNKKIAISAAGAVMLVGIGLPVPLGSWSVLAFAILLAQMAEQERRQVGSPRRGESVFA